MVFQLDSGCKNKINYANDSTISRPAPVVLGILQINRLVRKNLGRYDDHLIYYRHCRIHLYDLRAP